MECHMDMKSYRCTECNCLKSYSSSSHLKRHMKISHGTKKKSEILFICSFSGCNKVFTTSGGLQKHEKKHVTGHYCDKCKRFFKDSTTYDKHLVRNTRCGGPSFYFCEDCRLTFRNKNEFTLHCKKYHEPIPVTYYCGEANCFKSFRHKRNLKHHIEFCHSYNSVHICGESGCTKIFLYKRNLIQHKIKKHLNVVFKCPVEKCYRTFSYKKSLNYHIRLHKRNLISEKKKKEPKKPKDLAQEMSFSIANHVE